MAAPYTDTPSSRSAGALLGAAFRRSQRRFFSGGPPWRLLFFGTDQFAVESLRALTCSRSSGAGVVQSLEVVTLPGDVPVRRFARQHRLTLHSWPPELPEGRFDVGVVVSFGCLLQESLIKQFPHGILNVHPSLLPRWRGPAPIFHTILQGDAVTGVTIIQILPHKFDVGPILNQELHPVPDGCSADELGASLASKGAELLLDTLKTLPERIAARKEQGQTGVTFAPKISAAMSWMVWEEQTCEQIARLHRAIGSRVPLRTLWRGRTIKLLEFVGSRPSSGQRENAVPGSLHFEKEAGTLAVRCKDGWVLFKAMVLKKQLTATDFYNGYLHQSLQKDTPLGAGEGRFISRSGGAEEARRRKKSTL